MAFQKVMRCLLMSDCFQSIVYEIVCLAVSTVLLGLSIFETMLAIISRVANFELLYNQPACGRHSFPWIFMAACRNEDPSNRGIPIQAR